MEKEKEHEEADQGGRREPKDHSNSETSVQGKGTEGERLPPTENVHRSSVCASHVASRSPHPASQPVQFLHAARDPFRMCNQDGLHTSFLP